MIRTKCGPIAAIVLVLTACSTTTTSAHGASNSASDSTTDAATLLTRVLDAVGAQSGFTVQGTGTGDDGSQFAIAMHYGTRGSAGSIQEGGDRFDLIATGASILQRTSAPAWQAIIGARPDAAQDAAKLAPHWVRIPHDGAFASVAAFVDKQLFVHNLAQNASWDTGRLARSGTASVDGTAAVAFTDTKDGAKIYIAAHGQPLLMRVRSKSGGVLTFAQYGVPYTPTPPDQADVIDYTLVVS